MLSTDPSVIISLQFASIFPIYIFSWLGLLLAVLANTTCYNLDGSQAKGDVPCRQNGASNCCNKNHLCMSNGLCYMQGKRGLSLSRGSCTDRSWGECYSPCCMLLFRAVEYKKPTDLANENRNTGIPIVNIGYHGDETQYCCSAVKWENGKAGCRQGGDPSKLPFGRAIAGVAGLSSANASDRLTGNNETITSEGSNHDVAIGVGVGVPLGVLALTAFAWALWERRSRRSLAKNMSGMSTYPVINSSVVRYRRDNVVSEMSSLGPQELDTGEQGEQGKPV